MSEDERPPESLAPAPARSAWGRKVAWVYLVLAGLALLLTLREMAVGRPGVGTMAVSVLTAPWSVLLGQLGRTLAPSLAPGAARAAGVALLVLCALLNARILYGIAARAERDARARAPGR